MIQSRSLVIVFAVSFFIHAGLLVSSARNELDRARQPVGELLSSQLAASAAPLLMNHDTVGLGLLADRFGKTPGVLSLRVAGLDPALNATGGNAQTLSGSSFKSPVSMDNKPLGEVEVVLAGPANGAIVRNNGLQLLLSLLLHLGLAAWLIWPDRFRNVRVPILQPLPRRLRTSPEAVPAPIPVEPPPAATFFLQVALEDSKGLMQRVNASTADQMLVILEKLLVRSAKLYQGKVMHSFGPEGATVRFAGSDAAACLQQALACGRLFLALADTAYQQRRNAKLFALPVKASVCALGDREEGVALDEALQLARRGGAQDLLLNADESLAATLKTQNKLVSLDAPVKGGITDTIEAENEGFGEEKPADSAGLVQGEGDTAIAADGAAPETEAADTPESPPMNLAPWRVLGLADADEERIQEQKQQILERRKQGAPEETTA